MGKFGTHSIIISSNIQSNKRITTNNKARNTELSVDIGVISTGITQNTINFGDRDINKYTSTKSKGGQKKNKKK